MSLLEKRIITIFGVLSLIFFTAVVTTFIQINRVTESSRRIQNIFAPSIQANLRMANAVTTSVAALRGWVLTGNENFIRQRQSAWSIIDKSHTLLKNYSERWENQDLQDKLFALGEDLTLLRHYQLEAEKAFHDQSKAQELKILEEKSSSAADKVTTSIRKILDPQNWAMERIFIQEEKQQQALKTASVIFLILSLGSSAILGFIIIRSVITPINNTIVLAEAVADGNYSIDEEKFSKTEKLDIALREMTDQLYKKDEKNKLHQQTLGNYNKKLKDLNSELEISNEELSQFSYRTSHDLKAPLMTIQGLSEAISEDIDDGCYSDVKQSAVQINAHVEKLQNLIVDILDLAKADLQTLEEEKLNLEEIISEIELNLRSIYLDKDVKVESNIKPSVNLIASKVRVLQVLSNLVSNGIKYSDSQKSSRYVKIRCSKQENNTEIIIEDNGIGIPPEYHSDVYSMFKRFHPGMASGSGLGMYIVKKHLDKMKADISFESSRQGTIFKILIPDRQKNTDSRS